MLAFEYREHWVRNWSMLVVRVYTGQTSQEKRLLIQSLNEKRMPCKLLEQLTLKVQKSF